MRVQLPHSKPAPVGRPSFKLPREAAVPLTQLILDAYSLHKDDPRHLLERMRRYVMAFKYGRGDEGTGRDDDVWRELDVPFKPDDH